MNGVQEKPRSTAISNTMVVTNTPHLSSEKQCVQVLRQRSKERPLDIPSKGPCERFYSSQKEKGACADPGAAPRVSEEGTKTCMEAEEMQSSNLPPSRAGSAEGEGNPVHAAAVPKAAHLDSVKNFDASSKGLPQVATVVSSPRASQGAYRLASRTRRNKNKSGCQGRF